MLKASCLLTVVALALIISPSINAQQNELRSLATGLAQDIAISGKKSIAVVDFTDLQGHPTELGRYLAEEFSVALTRTRKGFDVIDRTHLNAILTENKLSATGLIDPATAKKLGQLVGADALLTGSMTPFSESVRISVKVLATDTARIIAADTTDLPKTSTIAQLLGNPIGDANKGPGSEKAPATEPAPAKSTSVLSGPKPNPKLVLAQFQFELTGCRGIANSVTCEFIITNRGPDRILTAGCSPSMTTTQANDNLGNQSPAESCVLVNKRGNYTVTAQFISGVPSTASVTFSNLSATASMLTRMTWRCLAGEDLNDTGFGTSVDVAFRNVPIVR